MPTVKRSAPATKLVQKKMRGGGDVEVTLPTTPHEPVEDWKRYAYLITGKKKIGKTSLCAEIKNALFLQCDKPQLALPTMEIIVDKWATSKVAISKLKELSEDEFPYPAVIVDGADNWYRYCQQWTCRRLGIDHPSDSGYARGWHMLRDEFQAAVDDLLRLPCGIFFLCHSTLKEIKTWDGTTKEAMVPVLAGAADETLTGKCDAWFSYEYFGRQRMLIVHGSETEEVGHRIAGHFRTVSGEPIEEVPMGNGPQEAFDNFIKAFENKQEQVKLPREKKKGAKRFKKRSAD